jgi:hypothetical protein
MHKYVVNKLVNEEVCWGINSVKCLDLYVYGKAFGQEDINEHSVRACSHVMCVAWRDIKGHKAGCVCCFDVYLAKYTNPNNLDAHWYGANSTTKKETEKCNGYKK